MKIDNLAAPQLRSKVAQARQSGDASSASQSSTGAGVGADRVQVSAQGAELAGLATQLGGVDGASEARVAEVKAELESGNSPLDIRALAESILQDEGY